MSFELAVWHPSSRLQNEEAAELYEELCEGMLEGVVPHASVDAFYEDLVDHEPEIEDYFPRAAADDHEICPWTSPVERSPGHVIVSFAASREDEVRQLVATLAAKHGLAWFDPQEERITYPPAAPAGPKFN